MTTGPKTMRTWRAGRWDLSPRWRTTTATGLHTSGRVPRTRKIVLDDLLCNGDESGLLECPSGHPRPGIHNCRHSEDVGLRCLKVGQSPPWIIDVEFSGPPGGNGVYDAGETVEATLVWSEPVTISTPSGGLLPKVWGSLWQRCQRPYRHRRICQRLRHGPHGVQAHAAIRLVLPGGSRLQLAGGA